MGRRSAYTFTPRGRCFTPSLVLAVSSCGVGLSAAPACRQECVVWVGGMLCPPSSQVMDSPSCVQCYLACWVPACWFSGCLDGCWLIGLWAAELGSLVCWLVGFLVVGSLVGCTCVCIGAVACYVELDGVCVCVCVCCLDTCCVVFLRGVFLCKHVCPAIAKVLGGCCAHFILA